MSGIYFREHPAEKAKPVEKTRPVQKPTCRTGFG